MSNTRKFLNIGGGLIGVASALGASYFILGDGDFQRTDDAYVSADFSIIAPKISGLIDRVDVDDNEHVRAGQELAHIDERDYRAAVSSASAALAAANADVENLIAEIARHQSLVEQARATVKADDAALNFAQANATRYSNLSRGGAGTVEQQQQSTSLLQQALANKDRDTAAATATERQRAILEAQRDKALAAAAREKAELEQAQLNLSYTHVLAPFDGVVGQHSNGSSHERQGSDSQKRSKTHRFLLCVSVELSRGPVTARSTKACSITLCKVSQSAIAPVEDGHRMRRPVEQKPLQTLLS